MAGRRGEGPVDIAVLRGRVRSIWRVGGGRSGRYGGIRGRRGASSDIQDGAVPRPSRGGVPSGVAVEVGGVVLFRCALAQRVPA